MRDHSKPASKDKGASRRKFLTGAAGLVAAGATRPALADNAKNLPPNVPDWTRQLGDGVGVRPYGHPSKFEKDVIRRTVPWLTATPESSVAFTPLHELDGIITPNGLCFERHHGGIAEVDPHDYRLMIHGLVDKPLIFTLDDIKRLPRVNRIHFLECAANSGMEWHGAQLNGVQYTHGMVHCVQYTGVPLKILLEQAGVKASAKWLLAEGADAAAMTRSIPLAKALDDCLVAYRMNGEMLRPEQGYPVRLVVPGYEGNVWVKWLRRLKVGDQPWYTREETSKYSDLMENGKARKFTFEMDAKSVITSPSPQVPLKQKGFTVISGLAWSGRGKVSTSRRVARRRPQLAQRAHRRAGVRPRLRALLRRDRVERRAAAVAIARHGRDRLRAADQGRFAQNPRRQFDLPQQRHSDLVDQAGRGGGECRIVRVMSSAATYSFLAWRSPPPALAQNKVRNYGIGHAATPQQIAGWDIDVRPDGQGAPAGHGSVKDGEKIYGDRCAACHGEFGESAGRWPALAQGKGTLATPNPVKTVGSYFPYLSTVFDYIRRAMPFGDAESLTNDELYAVTAYVLNLNDIVDDKFVLSKETWASVKMPNAGRLLCRRPANDREGVLATQPVHGELPRRGEDHRPRVVGRRHPRRADQEARGGIALLSFRDAAKRRTRNPYAAAPGLWIPGPALRAVPE